MPTFWLALLLQILFVDIYLKWNVRIFYTSGLNNPQPRDVVARPAAAHRAAGDDARDHQLRALQPLHARLDARRDQHATTCARRARRACRSGSVIMRHVFRNALIPIVTIAALNFGGLLGGAIVTETVFTLDGMGYYFIQKLQAVDLYAVMA